MKIVLALVVTLLFIGCSDDKSVEAQKEISQSIDKTDKVIKEEPKNIEKATTTVDTFKNEPKVVKKPLASKKILATKSTIDGALLFAKCTGCHGVKGEKKALNKSQSIKGWSVAKLTDALNGYKDGSYGGTMKGVMKPQVNKLSDDEIQALSEYISKL